MASDKQNPSYLERNLSIYPWYTRLCFTPFMVPIIVLFWEKNGLNTFDIYLLQGIFAIAIVLLEVPTGMVADLMGKRKSLIFGNLFNLAGCTLYACSSGFALFLSAELLLAVGMSLLSGASAALLYDSLKQLGRESEYAAREGLATSHQLISFAICALVGGLVGSHSLRLAIAMSILGPLLGTFLATRFREVHMVEGEVGSLASRYWTLVSDSKKFVLKHRLVRWFLLFFAIISGSATWMLWLYQPYMQACGLPIWAFGMVFALFNLYAAFISRRAAGIAARLGRAKTITLMMALQLLCLPLLVLIKAPWSFLFILGQQTNRGFMAPVLNQWILSYTFRDKRATVLSIAGLMGRLVFALGAPIVGLAGKNTSLDMAIIVQCFILFGVFSTLLILYQRIPLKYFHVKPSEKF